MGLYKLNPDKELNVWAKKEAQNIVDSLVKKIKVSEVYLFGSVASDQFTKDSDIDLLLVFENQDLLEHAKKIIYGKPLSTVGVDYILKTKEEFDKRKSIGGVCFEVLQHGVQLFG